jgi:NDP-sugar pyrophosphorylase family protein
MAAFAGTPLALADVVGRPAVHHLLRNLKQQNVSDVVVISETPVAPLVSPSRYDQMKVQYAVAEGAQLWRVAESSFIELAQNGAEEILVVRMGAYVEPDLESLLQTHMDNGTHATRAYHHGMPLDLYIMAASRRNDAAYLFRHRLGETRTRCGSWRFQGYWNALETAQHVRCLAVDALLGENRIQPDGRELRPGVWVARGASIHPRARVLAPAFIGEYTKVRANAVVTRCSVVEHHVEIDYGTVVEDASLLPYTYVGPGLDITRSVVGMCRVASIDHNVEIEIADARLVHVVSANAGRRALAHAASLATFLPVQFFRGMFGSTRHSKPSELPAAVQAPSALNTPAGFPAAPSAVEASSYHRTWQ